MRVLVGAFSVTIVARVISHTTVCSATQRIRGIINKNKILFLHEKKVVVDKSVLMTYECRDIVPEKF